MINLFLHQDKLPCEVQMVLNKYDIAKLNHETCKLFLEDLNKVNYTVNITRNYKPYNLVCMPLYKMLKSCLENRSILQSVNSSTNDSVHTKIKQIFFDGFYCWKYGNITTLKVDSLMGLSFNFNRYNVFSMAKYVNSISEFDIAKIRLKLKCNFVSDPFNSELNFIKWSEDFTGIDSDDFEWEFLFSTDWSEIDNTKEGFVKRCLFLLGCGELHNDWHGHTNYSHIEIPKDWK